MLGTYKPEEAIYYLWHVRVNRESTPEQIEPIICTILFREWYHWDYALERIEAIAEDFELVGRYEMAAYVRGRITWARAGR